MHNLLRESIIASVRRRAEQGDCPIEPRVSIANLEYALLDTADDLQKALTPSLPLADREAIAREKLGAAKRIDVKAIWEAHGGVLYGSDVEQYYIGGPAFYRFAAAYRDAILALSGSLPPSPVGEGVTTDVRRLVIAARMVAFDGDCDETKLRELDQASEAFADRVPWDDEPTPPTPAPVRGE